jgi:hypothetical protein
MYYNIIGTEKLEGSDDGWLVVHFQYLYTAALSMQYFK